MKCLLLIMLVFASDKNTNVLESDTKSVDENMADQPIVVKIEEDEYAKVNKTSDYFGVNFRKRESIWSACRWSKYEKKHIYNGRYKNEETAARASDTLARKLIANGEQGHKLNFPDNDTEMFREQKSNYLGVCYNKNTDKWSVDRWSKKEKKNFHNGVYKNEETAAHASDTLARKLIANGENGHKLNFPDDDTRVYPEELKFSSNYIGVSYSKRRATWDARRWSKKEKKNVHKRYFKSEETAAHASDTLARKLIANGEKGHKFNFPNIDTEVYPEEAPDPKQKRKRPDDLRNFQEIKSHQISKK